MNFLSKRTRRRIEVVLAVLLLGSAGFTTQTAPISRQFTVSPGGQLNVSAGWGDIQVSTWERNEVLVNVSGIREDAQQDLSITQSGNVVEVVYDPSGYHGNTQFDINVPANFNISLKTAGGDIALTGMLQGQIEGTTAGGDIDIEDIAGDAELTTAGGDILAGNIRGNVTLRTAGGDIRIGIVTGEADVKTSGGDIEVEDVGSTLRASTAGGDIRVGDIGGEALLSTSGGDIEVGDVSGNAELKTSGGDISLQSASGTVEAVTAGGDLDLLNITGSLTGKTAGGDIDAELRPSGSGTSRLETAGGEIALAVPRSARAHITAVIKIQGNWSHRIEEVDIHSDFESTSYVRDERNREIRGEFTINGGGEQIELRTVNGDIHLTAMAQ